MMPRVAILYLLAVSVWAQNSAAVSGRVVSATDGSPLSGALVLVRTTSVTKTWTGSDGRFRLADVPTGTHGVLISKAGFHSDQRRREVVAGETAQDLFIRLTPESVVAGTALGPGGEPLEGSKVSLWEQPDRFGNLPSLTERASVIVDDLGRFRLHGVRAGNYLLTLAPTATPAPGGVERLIAAPALYPEASGVETLATLRLRPGERIENIEFRASGAEQTALAGQIPDCERCLVGIYRRTGEFFAPVHQMTADEDGSFFLQGLAPGAYVVAVRNQRASKFGLAEASLAAGQTTRATVYLSEGVQMTITKKHQNPPKLDLVAQQRGVGPPAVMFEYLGPAMARSIRAGDRLPSPDADTTQMQIRLTPGPYALRVRGIPRGGYLASVLVNGIPPLNGRIVIGDEGQHQTEVVVAYDSGTVEGTVVAPDELLEGAHIYLAPQNPVLPNDLAETAADASGAFSLQVGPGRYDVYALPRDADWNLADPLDRQRLAGYRANVEVRPGQTVQVQVKMAPSSSW